MGDLSDPSNDYPPIKVGIAVFVMRDNSILMMKRKGGRGDGCWHLPGGHLEFGESFEACAKREVREETGMEITDVVFGVVTNDVDDQTHYVTIWMVAQWVSGEIWIREPDKCDGMRWVREEDGERPQPLWQPYWDNFDKALEGGGRE